MLSPTFVAVCTLRFIYGLLLTMKIVVLETSYIVCFESLIFAFFSIATLQDFQDLLCFGTWVLTKTHTTEQLAVFETS